MNPRDRIPAPAGRPPGLSSLWRSLSARNPHHLLMAALCAAGFGVVAAKHLGNGATPAEALGPAFNLAVLLFLGWAIAREIDPDHSWSAYPALALTAAIVGVAGATPAGAMVAMLFALRLVIRSTGQAPTPLDLLFLTLLAGGVAGMPRGWIGGAAAAAAMAWDTRLPSPGARRNVFAAAVAFVASLAVAGTTGNLRIGFVEPGPFEWVTAGAGVLAFALLRTYKPTSVEDRGRSTINSERLVAGRRLTLATGAVAFVLFGASAVPLLSAVWAALTAVWLHDTLLVRRVSGRQTSE
ncbi:MAG TPA: hypothetical protein VHJ78_11600 [Actinomycetota bacterium]|nr:hypothetical protein [Actinomycetota bacterium]